MSASAAVDMCISWERAASGGRSSSWPDPTETTGQTPGRSYWAVTRWAPRKPSDACCWLAKNESWVPDAIRTGSPASADACVVTSSLAKSAADANARGLAARV